MRVGEVIDTYVALKTSLGMSFESPRRVLEQFSREIGNPPLGEVQAEARRCFPSRARCPKRHVGTEIQNTLRLLSIRD